MDARTFIVIPASDVPVELAEFRRQYIQHPGAVIPLHTTLIAPFLSLRDLERGGLSRLREVAAGVSPFRYYASSICTFPTSYAIWLAPTPVAPFEQLAQAIYDRFPEAPRDIGYPTYHMTIGLTRAQDDIPQVVSEFQQRFAGSLPMHFLARELAVYAVVDEEYRLHSVVELGG